MITPIPQPRQIRARLRNAIRSAATQLRERGISGNGLLEPIQDLASQLELDKKWASALLLFRSPDSFHYWWWRGGLTDSVTVGDRFQMRPLFRLAAQVQRFYLLAISEKNVQLFRCTQQRIETVPISLPRTLHEWLNTRQPDHDLWNRSTAGPSTGSMKGVTFGTTSDREREAEYLRLFVTDIQERVAAAIREDPAPLVLAGTDRDVSLYQRLNTYPDLIPEPVNGSPDGLSDQDLYQKSWDVVRGGKSPDLKKALDEFEPQTTRGGAPAGVREIVKAAFEGRIADLFIRENDAFIGKWDPAVSEAQEHADGEDLFNAAAQETIRQSGRAFELASPDMPINQPVAAVFRY
jgi:hypothetical protein